MVVKASGLQRRCGVCVCVCVCTLTCVVCTIQSCSCVLFVCAHVYASECVCACCVAGRSHVFPVHTTTPCHADTRSATLPTHHYEKCWWVWLGGCGNSLVPPPAPLDSSPSQRVMETWFTPAELLALQMYCPLSSVTGFIM